MKISKRTALGAILALGAGSAALAQQPGHGTMTPEQHKQMMAGHASHAAKVTNATGVVKAIDPATRSVTIAHDAIAAKNWPAMTMTFKVSARLLGQLKAGQRVKFSFVGEGTRYTIANISAQ